MESGDSRNEGRRLRCVLYGDETVLEARTWSAAEKSDSGGPGQSVTVAALHTPERIRSNLNGTGRSPRFGRFT